MHASHPDHTPILASHIPGAMMRAFEWSMQNLQKNEIDEETSEQEYFFVHRRMGQYKWNIVSWTGPLPVFVRVHSSCVGALVVAAGMKDRRISDATYAVWWLRRMISRPAFMWSWLRRYSVALRTPPGLFVPMWMNKWRAHVRVRGVAMYWLGETTRATCAPHGVGRKRDREAFEADFA